jgi:GTPase SAR1 family protein
MSFINYSAREINCKIVYYGPGLCGKTTNLLYIYKKTNPDSKGKMISLAPKPNGRCLRFLAVVLEVSADLVRFHLYTVRARSL